MSISLFLYADQVCRVEHFRASDDPVGLDLVLGSSNVNLPQIRHIGQFISA